MLGSGPVVTKWAQVPLVDVRNASTSTAWFHRRSAGEPLKRWSPIIGSRTASPR